MSDDFPWVTVIVGAVASIPLIGAIYSLVTSSLQHKEERLGGSRMTSSSDVKDEIKEILRKMDPIDSLYFDVSVARHLLEEGNTVVPDVAKVLEWLDPQHALGELKKSYNAKFLTSIEFDKVGQDVIDIKNAISGGQLAEAHRIIVPLQERLAEKAYTTFKELDPVPNGYIDGRYESAREKKVAEWKAKGYPEALIEKTLKWANEWARGIAARFIRDPVMRAQVEESLYPQALELSEKFIEAMAK